MFEAIVEPVSSDSNPTNTPVVVKAGRIENRNLVLIMRAMHINTTYRKISRYVHNSRCSTERSQKNPNPLRLPKLCCAAMRWRTTFPRVRDIGSLRRPSSVRS